MAGGGIGKVVGVSTDAAIERRDLHTGATVWEAYPTRPAGEAVIKPDNTHAACFFT